MKAFAVALVALAPGLAAAAPEPSVEAQALGKFKDWDTYKLTRNGETTCYAVSNPKETTPKNLTRDQVFFMISNWPGRKITGEPSVIAGYAYRDGSTVELRVGSAKFELYTKDDSAWFVDGTDEKKFVTAMKTGSSMTVKGTSARGTITTDKYSLSGISSALDKINTACK